MKQRLIAILLGAATMLIAEPAKIPPAPVVGHRGFSAKAPENTLAAIDLAIKAGAHGIEFDVRRAKDGTAVIFHDATLERTSNGKGRVDRASLTALRKLDVGGWKGNAYTGEKIPLLKEAVDLCVQANRIAVIELKDPGLAKAVVKATADISNPNLAVVIAFDDRELRRLHQIAPEIPKLWLCGKLPKGSIEERADYVAARCKKCGATGVDMNQNLLSEALIKALQARQLAVWCYTVNGAPRMKELYAWGIDGITSDRPDVLKSAYEDAKQ